MMRARLLSSIGWLLISFWSRSVRIRFVNRSVPDRLKAEGKNFIYAFWHGRQFLLFHNHRDSGVVIPASESRDGEIQAGILKRFGFDVVRGSSKRKGDRALLGLVEGLRAGKNIALAVDGPRGPIYEVKPGVTYLAGKLGKVIVPVAASAKRFWILEKIWDKYLLPLPFTRGVIVYGEPVVVKGIGEEELEATRHTLTDALNKVMNQADACFQKKGS
ncbi:MAG TPA: lysophospholipid acyltransferase family protein [Nitrospirota bacterium]|nr:lysophospholipid acyltransferase family protein [Nitrospirota bacterium]